MIDARNELKVALIRKHSYEYYGIAYECSKAYINKRTYENFFGALYEENSIEYIKLTADECKQMVKNKKCEMNQMSCNENNGNLKCDYEVKLNASYSWMSSIYMSTVNCKIRSRKIAQNKHTINNCDLKSKECELDQSILVWNNDVYDNCNYEKIKELQVVNLGNELYQEKNNSHIFKIVKEIKTKETCNNVSVFKTAEGLYLNIIDKHGALKINENKYSTIDLAEYNQLLLSEIDGIAYENYKQQQLKQYEQCELFKQSLNIIKYTVDESYERFEFNNNKSYIFYVKNKILFLPKCQIINEIILINSSECFEDVKIKINGYNKILFLNENKIITNNSKPRNCSETIIRKLNNKLIIEKDNQITIKNMEESVDLDILEKKMININFPHYAELIEQHELVEIYGELLDNKIKNEYKFIDKINSTLDIKNMKAVNIMKKLVNTLILTIIITAAIIILVLIIVYLLPTYINKSRNIVRSATLMLLNSNNNKEIEALEMSEKTSIKNSCKIYGLENSSLQKV
jgi:hypothetical protein